MILFSYKETYDLKEQPTIGSFGEAVIFEQEIGYALAKCRLGRLRRLVFRFL